LAQRSGGFCLPTRQRADETLHRRDQQVVRVFHGAASQHRPGVHGEAQRLVLQEPGLLGLDEAFLEDSTHLVVQDELGAEELQGAPGAERLAEEGAQHRAPAGIKGAARDGLPIGDARFLLEDQQQGELGRRDARPAQARVVEAGEFRVIEELVGDFGELAVERLGVEWDVLEEPDVVEIHRPLALAHHRWLLAMPRCEAPPGDSRASQGTPQRFVVMALFGRASRHVTGSHRREQGFLGIIFR
jgi:hypothetical protein